MCANGQWRCISIYIKVMLQIPHCGGCILSRAARPNICFIITTQGYNVAYVGNLAFEATDKDVLEFFKPMGATKAR